MGVHTRATEIIKEHGYKADMAAHTRGRDLASAVAAARVLAEGVSREGLVRVYAVLQAAKEAKPAGGVPSISLGEGPMRFLDALRGIIDEGDRSEQLKKLEKLGAEFAQELAKLK